MSFPIEAPFDTVLLHDPAADTAAVVTLDADAARRNVIGQIICSYNAAPTALARVTVLDGSTKVFEQYIGAGNSVIDFNPPRAGTVNTAMTITLLAPGGAVVGRLFVNAWRKL